MPLPSSAASPLLPSPRLLTLRLSLSPAATPVVVNSDLSSQAKAGALTALPSITNGDGAATRPSCPPILSPPLYSRSLSLSQSPPPRCSCGGRPTRRSPSLSTSGSRTCRGCELRCRPALGGAVSVVHRVRGGGGAQARQRRISGAGGEHGEANRPVPLLPLVPHALRGSHSEQGREGRGGGEALRRGRGSGRAVWWLCERQVGRGSLAGVAAVTHRGAAGRLRLRPQHRSHCAHASPAAAVPHVRRHAHPAPRSA